MDNAIINKAKAYILSFNYFRADGSNVWSTCCYDSLIIFILDFLGRVATTWKI
jgi:hypothetical protein